MLMSMQSTNFGREKSWIISLIDLYPSHQTLWNYYASVICLNNEICVNSWMKLARRHRDKMRPAGCRVLDTLGHSEITMTTDTEITMTTDTDITMTTDSEIVMTTDSDINYIDNVLSDSSVFMHAAQWRCACDAIIRVLLYYKDKT